MMKSLTAGLSILLAAATCCFSNEITIIDSQGKGELIYPTQIEEGPDGNIYISDAHDASIKVFLPSGTFLRKMAGHGEGPGEMKRMGRFGFSASGSEIYFTEFFGGHRWITFLDLTGKYTRVHQLKVTGFFGILNAIMLSDNRFICEIHTLNEDSIQKGPDYYTYTYPILLVVLNEQGKIEKIMEKQNSVSGISLIDNGAEITIPFRPRFLWDRYHQEILFSDGLGSKIKKFDFKGKKIGEISLHLPQAESINKSDIDNWRNNLKARFQYRDRDWFLKFGRVIDRYKNPIYKRKPLFDKLQVTENGLIFLFKNKAAGVAHSTGWLVDLDGHILLNFNSMCGDIKLSKTYIFFTTTDTDENTLVGFFKRSGTIESDIVKFLQIAETK